MIDRMAAHKPKARKKKPANPQKLAGIAAFDRTMRGLIQVPKAELSEQIRNEPRRKR
jgi:hypothetical protein